MQTFKIRCSAIGQIMTNPRTKSEKLSQTAKTYCQNWIIQQKFGRAKEIHSKYLTKGIEKEQEAIDFLIKHDKISFLAEKNEEHYMNPFMQGTPDIILPDMVIDIKCSWDLFSFPYFSNEAENKAYWWQLQGYMHLTGKTKAQLIYVLINTPEPLIEKEIDYALRGFEGSAKEAEAIEAQIRKNLTFGDIPVSDRIRTFEIERDEDAIKAIEARVMECREYIKTCLQ